MVVDIYSMRASGPARVVLMTVKQLNIPHNIKNVDLTLNEQMNPDFVKMNPAHCVPTINDNGFVLWESRAVMQYLCNQYAPNSSLYPKDSKKRAIVDRWLNFDMSLLSSQPPVFMRKPFIDVDPLEDKVNTYENNLKLLDQLIGDNKYITGNKLTIADLSVLATLSYRGIASVVDQEIPDDYPNINRWRSALKKELPYYDEINVFTKEEFEEMMAKMKAKLTAQQQKK